MMASVWFGAQARAATMPNTVNMPPVPMNHSVRRPSLRRVNIAIRVDMTPRPN